MAKIFISPLAEMDLRGIRAYIEQESGDEAVALKQVASITKTIRLLKDQPYMGKPLTAIIGIITDYRFLVSGSYYVFYKQVGDNLHIVRVLHCARDFMRVLFGVTQ